MILKILTISVLLCAQIFSSTSDNLTDFSKEAIKVAGQTFNSLRRDTDESFANLGLCRKTCEDLVGEVKVREPYVGDVSLAKIAPGFVKEVMLSGEISEAMQAVTADSESILQQLAGGYDDLCVAVERLNKRRSDQREAVDFLANTVKTVLAGVIQRTLRCANINNALNLVRGETDLQGFVRDFPGGYECERGVSGLEGLRLQQDVWFGELQYLVLNLLKAGASSVFLETKEAAKKAAQVTLDAAWDRTQAACKEGGTPSLVFDEVLSSFPPDADYQTEILPSVEKAGREFMQAMQEVPLIRRRLHNMFRRSVDASEILRDLSSRTRLMQGVLKLEKRILQTRIATKDLESLTHDILSRGKGPSVNRALSVVQKEPALQGPVQSFVNSVRGRRIVSGLLRQAYCLKRV